MNQSMREMHFATIVTKRARDIYERLCGACEERQGGMTDADQLLVGDYARNEQLKSSFEDDIVIRGIGQEVHNGKQVYWAENKSVTAMNKCIEQQRKLLNELKLTPAARKSDAQPIAGDDFDEF